MEQHDLIALTPLKASEARAGEPSADGETGNAYAWTAIVHPPQGFAESVTVLRTPSGWYGVSIVQVR
jgi:hypothetical protein